MHYYVKFFILILYIAVLAPSANTQIQVNSLTSTVSTCPNNGTITVDATSPSLPVLYSITVGPVTQQVQTNPVFNSLPAGNYTVKISDGAGNEVLETVTIGGNYQNPDFTAVPTIPYCVGESSGKIALNITNGTGLAPFSWQLMPPSPASGTQIGNTFENLPAGSYSVRVTDACGSISTKAITITSPSSFMKFYGGLAMTKVGCDTIKVRYKLDILEAKLPFTYSFQTPNGTQITPVGAPIVTGSANWTGYVTFEHTLPNLTYGDTIKATITNACGEEISSTLSSRPFYFYPYYTALACGNTVDATYSITPPNGAHTTILKNPVSYTYTDVATNTVVASGSAPAPNLPPDFGVVSVDIRGGVAIPGRTYQLVLTDGCGQTFTQNYIIPNKTIPSVKAEVINAKEACLDSVLGRLRIVPHGFGTGTRLVFTSGPATLGSTKPDYVYSDTYTWPSDTIYSSSTFFFSNLAAGTYHYTIIDDCGAKIDTSFTIFPSQVANLGREVKITKGCPGENKLNFTINGGGEVTVKDLSDNTVIKAKKYTSNSDVYNRDSVVHLASGYYEITFDYEKMNTQTILNDNPLPCWKVIDTIFIPPYQSPEISVGNMIICNGLMNFALTPDSSKGVSPYQYEVYAGPQTFPLQNSNIFQVSSAGTYSVRIHDICGNATTKQITVDTLSFEPIELTPDCTSRKITFPSSIYYTHEWILPNGQVHVGDSLSIHPVTPADTGTYEIYRITNINGCTDTVKLTYQIDLPNYSEQTIPFCQGTTVVVGGNVYDTPGVYTDTLITASGCDSLVITTLTLLPQISDTTIVSICNGDSTLISGNYYSASGFYTDSIQNTNGCYDLQVTELIVAGQISSHEYITLCNNESYSVGSNSYNTTGVYYDTIQSSLGCDSIVVLHLDILPEINHSFYASICQNESYSFAGNLLNQSGIYTDTLTSSSLCDSIVSLHLMVTQVKTDTLTATICEGDFFSFAGNQLTTQGIYTDTIQTNTCDSILVLYLTVLPGTYHHIYDTICQGDNYVFGGLHYIHSGSYTITFPTLSCDSVITLHLTVKLPPMISVTSTPNGGVESGDVVLLNVSSNTQPVAYQWNSNGVLSDPIGESPTIVVDQSTWVTLTVTDLYGCASTVGYTIQLKDYSTLYVPNAVTPDGDEFNNFFRVYGTNISRLHIIVFDRWGEVIFESEDFNFIWDLTYRGKRIQDGIYVYKLFAVGLDNVIYDRTGHITVIR